SSRSVPTSCACAARARAGAGTSCSWSTAWPSSTAPLRQSRPVPDQEQPYRNGLPAVFDVVKRLRAPDGCPWDREQTHESLRQYLLEETYEVLEAIDSGRDDKLKEELGDLLLQVAMHAEIAEQEGRFDSAAVSEQAAAKMVSRHPHVFGSDQVADAEK